MKKAFSLLEIIIGILIIGLISSFAIPKLMDTKDFASATTLKRDIFSIVSSAQTYNLANAKFEIEKAIQFNDNWKLDGDVLTDTSGCVEIEFKPDDSIITLTLNDQKTEICDKLSESGINTQDFEL